MQETFYCGSEASRAKAIDLIRRAPLFDGNERQLVIVIKRAVTDYGRSKKRKFHAYVNLLAEALDAPAPAVKESLKAHLCPLVEELDVVTGEMKAEPKGVSQLSDEEAKDLCEKTVQLSKDKWDIRLPVTDEEFELVRRGGLIALAEREHAKKTGVRTS